MNKNIYNQEELDRIKKVEEKNDKLEEFFTEKRTEWNNSIDPLFKALILDLNQSANMKVLLDAQASALSYRQNINEQITYFLSRRSRETSNLKKLRQDKFLFYAVGFELKTNNAEKAILIDGNLNQNDRSIELIDSHIDYLRSTSKTLESFQYSIKSMIDLYNYLGK